MEDAATEVSSTQDLIKVIGHATRDDLMSLKIKLPSSAHLRAVKKIPAAALSS